MRKVVVLLLFVLLSMTLVSSSQKKRTVNLSFNSSYSEFGVSFYDKYNIVVASSKKDVVSIVQPYTRIYKGSITSQGEINNVKVFSDKINEDFHQSNIYICKNKKKVYYTRVSHDNSRVSEICSATISSSGEWLNIKVLSINGPKYSCASPVLNKDETIMYFSSNMKGGFGKGDLYSSEINSDGSFEDPKNLGEMINSKYSEGHPFMYNNSLYFSSNRKGGRGGLDVYVSNYLGKGNYSDPRPLRDINSKKDDFSFIINEETGQSYFSSNRRRGKGEDDIYYYKWTKVELSELRGLVKIVGSVKDIEGNPIVEGISMVLYKDGELRGDTVSDGKGNYAFEIEPESRYMIECKKDGLVMKSKYITVITEKENNLDFEIDSGGLLYVEGVVMDDRDNSKIEGSLIKIATGGVVISEISTLEDGRYKFNVDYGKTYNISVLSEGYRYVEKTITVDGNFLSKKDIYMQKDANVESKAVSMIVVSGVIRDSSNRVYIPGSKVGLYINGNLINSVYSSLSSGFYEFKVDNIKNGYISVEASGYADNRKNVNLISGGANMKLDFEMVKNKPKSVVAKTKEPVSNCEKSIKGVVTYSKGGDFIANVNVVLLRNNEEVSKKRTGIEGEFDFKMKCERGYSIKLLANGMKTRYFTVVNVDKKEEFVNLKMDFMRKPVHNTVAKNINTTADDLIYFEYNNHVYKEQEKEKLLKILDNMQQQDDLNLSLIGYTDSRGGYRYNLALSEKRVKSVFNFLVSKGVDKKRISYTGRGKSGSIEESYGYTEDQHGLGRRVEIRYVNVNGEGNMYYDEKDIVVGEGNKGVLDSYIEELKKNSKAKLNISSHSDANVSDRDNKTISDNRIDEVVYYLESKGISEDKYTVYSFGNTMPVVNCSKPKEYYVELKKDRRVEFKVSGSGKYLRSVNYNTGRKHVEGVENNDNLDYIVRLLLEYPSLELTMDSYTDYVGNADYNLLLSQQRADILKQKIVDRGVDEHRLTVVAYGETESEDKSIAYSDGCSDEEHSLNRRVSFELTK